jgi:hypothetical protein
LNVDAPNQFFALDASGKSAAHRHHRRYRKARAAKSAAGFFIYSDAIRGEVSNYPTCCIAFSVVCWRLENHLTRRANHRLIITIAKIVQSPGGEIRRGLFC